MSIRKSISGEVFPSGKELDSFLDQKRNDYLDASNRHLLPENRYRPLFEQMDWHLDGEGREDRVTMAMESLQHIIDSRYPHGFGRDPFEGFLLDSFAGIRDNGSFSVRPEFLDELALEFPGVSKDTIEGFLSYSVDVIGRYARYDSVSNAVCLPDDDWRVQGEVLLWTEDEYFSTYEIFRLPDGEKIFRCYGLEVVRCSSDRELVFAELDPYNEFDVSAEFGRVVLVGHGGVGEGKFVPEYGVDLEGEIGRILSIDEFPYLRRYPYSLETAQVGHDELGALLDSIVESYNRIHPLLPDYGSADVKVFNSWQNPYTDFINRLILRYDIGGNEPSVLEKFSAARSAPERTMAAMNRVSGFQYSDDMVAYRKSIVNVIRAAAPLGVRGEDGRFLELEVPGMDGVRGILFRDAGSRSSVELLFRDGSSLRPVEMSTGDLKNVKEAVGGLVRKLKVGKSGGVKW